MITGDLHQGCSGLFVQEGDTIQPMGFRLIHTWPKNLKFMRLLFL
jgi:hypothetical protein